MENVKTKNVYCPHCHNNTMLAKVRLERGKELFKGLYGVILYCKKCKENIYL